MHAQGTAHAHAHAHGHGANRFGLWYSNHGRQLSQIPTLMVDTELAATSTLTLRQLRPSQSSTHKMQRPPTEEELAALRQLSDDYRPSLEVSLGPAGSRGTTVADSRSHPTHARAREIICLFRFAGPTPRQAPIDSSDYGRVCLRRPSLRRQDRGEELVLSRLVLCVHSLSVNR